MKDNEFLPLNIQLFGEESTAENSAENTADNAENETKEEAKKEEKTFTQEELNTIVQERLNKAKKGIPSQEELKAFNDWKESQKTAEEKSAEKEKENQKILSERDVLKKENLLLKKGVNEEDIDYVIFKVSKKEGEFEDNLKEFLTNNPKFLKSYETPNKNIDLSGNHSKEAPNDDELINKIMGIK